MTLYTDLLAAGCEMGNHESDLHVKCTPEAARIIKSHQAVTKKEIIYSTFESGAERNADGSPSLWWDIPFAFDPFWGDPEQELRNHREKNQRRAAERVLWAFDAQDPVTRRRLASALRALDHWVDWECDDHNSILGNIANYIEGGKESSD